MESEDQIRKRLGLPPGRWRQENHNFKAVWVGLSKKVRKR